MAAGVATAIALMAVLVGQESQRTAPKVVRTDPARGAVIASGPFVLSVTFDQPMSDGSFSYVQKAADTFPDCAFPARLSPDRRTFTVRCTAAPGRAYELWFNSEPYMNFKGVDGTAAIPFQLKFGTKGR